MVTAVPRGLQDEWAQRLRASGFKDIEAPSGLIQRRTVSATAEANSAREEEYFAKAEAFLAAHRFANQLERLIWEQHAQRKGRRVVATTLGIYPKKVDAVVARLKAIMERPKRGAPRGHRHDSYRSEGMTLVLRLRPAHRAALDRLVALLGVESSSEAARQALMFAARRINGNTAK